jgi:hypothetical protein
MDALFSSLQQTDQSKLLKNQQISQDKINQLLEQATSSLLCGPTCQKTKKTEELRQKYIDAETNLQTAPVQLEQSRKNYYVFSHGSSYYDNMLEKELNEKAEQITSMLTDNFRDELTSATTMNQYLNSALISTSYSENLLDELLKKNEELRLKLRNNHGDILTNNRKTYYQEEAIERLKLWHKIWWYIYYTLVAVFGLCWIIIPTNIAFFTRFFITILLVFYPYYIEFILRTIYGFFYQIYRNLPKNVYNSL